MRQALASARPGIARAQFPLAAAAELGFPVGKARFQRRAHALEPLRRRQQRQLAGVQGAQLLRAHQCAALERHVGERRSEAVEAARLALEQVKKRQAALVLHRARAQRDVLVEQAVELAHRSLDLAPEHALDDLLQRARADVLLAELGQHGGDVFGKRRAGREDLHLGGGERVAAAVEQVGGAVHRHAGLAGAGAADHGHHPRALAANGGVLLRLNGGDDLAHVARRRAGEDVQQHAVVDAHMGIDVELQLAFLHAVLALERHRAAHHAGGTGVACLAGLGIVIEAADRRAPVVYQRLLVLARHAVQPDDDALRRRGADLGEVDAREERLAEHAAGARGRLVCELAARGKAVDVGGELAHLAGRQRRGPHAQLVPGVGEDGANRLRVAARQRLRLRDQRREPLAHARGIGALRLEFDGVHSVQSFHKLPPFTPAACAAGYSLIIAWRCEKEKRKKLHKIRRADFPIGAKCAIMDGDSVRGRGSPS